LDPLVAPQLCPAFAARPPGRRFEADFELRLPRLYSDDGHHGGPGLVTYDGAVPNLALPRPRPIRQIRRTGLTVPVAPTEVAAPEIIEAAGIRWIQIESPRAADRDWLEANFDFHPLDYEDIYSRNNRSKLDQYDDYVFIVLHFPTYEKATGRLLVAELDLFMGPDYLITLPNIPLPPLTAMFERYREKDELREATFSKGSGYLLYKIVDTCVDASFPMLRKVAVKLDRIEDDIFEGRSSEIVRDISEAKQEIINFRRIARPQRAVLRDLERTKQRYLQDELDIYFDDISDAAERIWDTLENDKEVVEALESTNESVLSHRLNDSFRILTAASVVLLPLTLIASIFGMNVPIPGQDHEASFLTIMMMMAVLLVVLVAYFRRRGWL
jgi:magnesium transporter